MACIVPRQDYEFLKCYRGPGIVSTVEQYSGYSLHIGTKTGENISDTPLLGNIGMSEVPAGRK